MSYTLISDLFSEDNNMPKQQNMNDRFSNGTSQYRSNIYQDDFGEDNQQYSMYNKKSILPNTKISNHFIPKMADHTENYQDVLKQIFEKLSSMSVKDTPTCNCTTELNEIKKKVDSSDIMLKGVILVLFILLIVVLLKK